MKYYILVLCSALCLFNSVISTDAQVLCPNGFICGDTLVDPRDSIKYPTVQIGTQCWMTLNMRATKYINGDSINHITNNNAWASMTTGAWCDQNNNATNGIVYGHIYNWYAVNDSRGLCPKGWYVPTDNELIILVNYLGGPNVAGGAMKQAGTTYWESPNTGATNTSGFNAVPGGYRDGNAGFFNYFPYDEDSWVSQPPGVYILDYTRGNILMPATTGATLTFGESVRCFRDN